MVKIMSKNLYFFMVHLCSLVVFNNAFVNADSQSKTCENIQLASHVEVSYNNGIKVIDIDIDHNQSIGYVISENHAIYWFDYSIEKPSLLSTNKITDEFNYPYELMYYPNNNVLYICADKFNKPTLYAIECSKENYPITTIASITLESRLFYHAADEQLIYISTENCFKILNAASKQIIDEICLETHFAELAEMAWANNKLYITDILQNYVYVFEKINKNETMFHHIKTISVANSVHDIIASNNEDYIYISHNDDTKGKITVIDTQSDEEFSNIDLPSNPQGLAIFGDNLFVALYHDDAIAIINTQDNSLIADNLDSYGSEPCCLAVDNIYNKLIVLNLGSYSSIDLFQIQFPSLPNFPIIEAQTLSNDTTPTWSWKSGGGGSGIFRHSWSIEELGDKNGSSLTSFTPSSVLSEGFHTLYVQEKNDDNCWSNPALYTILVDSKKPSTTAKAPAVVDAQTRCFTITCSFHDDYFEGDTKLSGSGVESISLWAKKPGEKQFALVDTPFHYHSAKEGYFNYYVDSEASGAYFFYTLAKDYAGNTELHSTIEKDIKTVYTKNFSGYAILSVGAAHDNEGIDSHTLTANKVFRHLVNRNFAIIPESNNPDPLDHIKYYNPYLFPQYGEDNFPEGLYKEYLKQAITIWAVQKIQQFNGPLFITCIDHGGNDVFYLENNSFITANELNSWLEIMEQALLPKTPEIIIILGACYSGSFIETLSAKNRILITSTSSEETSFRGQLETYFDPQTGNITQIRDGEFFITELFNEIGSGKDLKTGYEIAAQHTSQSFGFDRDTKNAPFYDGVKQHPLIDDNGDKEGSFIDEGFDGDRAKELFLGYSIFDDKENFEIKAVGSIPDTPILPDSNQITLWAEVKKDDYTITHLWAEICPPDINAYSSGTQKYIDLIKLEMKPTSVLNRYEVVSDDFVDPGKYTISFFASYQVNADITSLMKSPRVLLNLYKQKTENEIPNAFKLLFPPDGATDKKTTCDLIWENNGDPDGDKVTYTLLLSKDDETFSPANTIMIKNIVDSSKMLHLPTDSSNNWDKITVYWKVLAIDEYGAVQESNVWHFIPDNNNDMQGFIRIKCIQDTKNNYIENAEVSIVSGNYGKELTETGREYHSSVVLDTPSQLFNLTVSKTGYISFVDEITIRDGKLKKIEKIVLQKNGNPKIGLDTVISLMKHLSESY